MKMVYPMNWETFYMDTLIGKVDIVLNPVISSNFNIYRSPTKFFDTTRLGAVGIYSNIEPFSDFINNNHDGILLDNDIELWNKKINYLLENLDLRNQILLNATTFRFDGSDLMPGPIGAGSFWTGMVDYTGGKSAKDVTAAIQKSWDAIK